jgi:hypothetical protein
VRDIELQELRGWCGDGFEKRQVLEATARIELAIKVLQTLALPLGYVASSNDLIVPGPCVLREWSGAGSRGPTKLLSLENAGRRRLGWMIGNSLFVLLLALMHASPSGSSIEIASMTGSHAMG